MSKIFISLLLLILSVTLIATGMILFGLYLFIAAFCYFQFVLLTWGQKPKPKSKVIPHHVTAEEFFSGYYNRNPEIRAKHLATRQRQKQRERQRQFHSTSRHGDIVSNGIFATCSNLDRDDDSDALSSQEDIYDDEQTYINPASGEPMIGGMAGVDSSGNSYGYDSQYDHFDMFDCFDVLDTFCDSTIDESISYFEDNV